MLLLFFEEDAGVWATITMEVRAEHAIAVRSRRRIGRFYIGLQTVSETQRDSLVEEGV